MTVRPFQTDSPDYRAACELRRRFLRAPLGLELTPEDTAGEDRQHHFGVYDPAGRLIGAAIGKPDPQAPTLVRIRQVVVDEVARGRGAGRALMAGVEAGLARRGFREAVLYAREDAAPFYERCGYERTGARAVLIGLDHAEMRKALSIPSAG